MISLAGLALCLCTPVASLATRRGGHGSGSSPTVQVKNGTYTGVYSAGYDQDFFLGMPYAQPPVGDLRFRIPASLNESWSDSRAATQYSGECYGYSSDQWNYAVSEDCLYINVIRPSGAGHAQLPVALWIHGGGFYAGGGVDQRYNASFMVQHSVSIGKPIIVVNFNYRLSAWGFLSSNEVAGVGATNLGLRDQRLAMQWVQENIAAFGGDPSQVTIFGESAGAASVGYQLTAYGGRDDKLFRGAIMQSGNPISYGALNGPEAYQDQYDALVNRTNCNGTLDTLKCLRTVPAEQLNAAINTTTSVPLTGFAPWLDGDFIQRFTSVQVAEGGFVHVPIISGANSDEGASFSPRGANSSQDFYNLLTAPGSRSVPPAFANQILEAYPDDLSVNVMQSLGDARPSGGNGSQLRRTASYYGDAVFIANRRLTCQTWAAAGVPAYCYRFNALTSNSPYWAGVQHFQEISYVFLNLDGVGYPPVAKNPYQGLGQSYIDLSYLMNGDWISFVHDLDPNAWRGSWKGSEALWPKYDNSNPQDYVFDANVTSYAEPDTYRSQGIDLINANNVGVYHR